MQTYIEAISVNHATSLYMELMLRSLFVQHPAKLPMSLTIMNNASDDDTTTLVEYAASQGISVTPSGYAIRTQNNSHGEILRNFVLTHPGCSHYLFLDADVCFVEENTLGTMLVELEQATTAFAIGPRFSWDGKTEIPLSVRQTNPDICDARLHPGCALVRNTPLFRHIVEVIGLSCVNYLWADRDEYLDTFKLMTQVMLTHNLTHIFSTAMVQHTFSVSYSSDSAETLEHKTRMRDQRLAVLRGRGALSL